MPRSRRRLKARRRLASVACLPSVIIGSTTRRSSFALGRVVWMISCFNSETVMFRSIARRWLLVRLSFLSPWRWRIFLYLRLDHAVRAVSSPAGGQFSSFMPSVSPREASTSLISLSDFRPRSEEHTSELQSLAYLVCRLLLEKKKKKKVLC